MRVKFLFLAICTAWQILAACNNKHIKNDRSANSDSVKPTPVVNQTEGFSIENIQFKQQHKYTDTGYAETYTDQSSCMFGFSKLAAQELPDFISILNEQSSYLSYDGDLNGLLNDSIFVTILLKNILHAESDFFKLQHLHFVGTREVNVASYGKCFMTSFKYLAPASATQSAPTLLFNPQKKEVTYWGYDAYTIEKGVVILDLKVRNANHTLFTVKYDDKRRSFIPDCFKVVKKDVR